MKGLVCTAFVLASSVAMAKPAPPQDWAKLSTRPSWWPGSLVNVRGRLSHKQVQDTLKSGKPQLVACRELSKKAILRFSILGDGTPVGITAEADNATIATCLEGAVAMLRFAVAKGTTSVEATLALATPKMPTVRAPAEGDLAEYLKTLKRSKRLPLVASISTNRGQIRCKLFPKKAPLTVANFIGLANGLKPFRARPGGPVLQRPFYDGLTFHRVIPNFMIQGGDPDGNGRGGPGYKFANEIDSSLRHNKPGVLSMANAGPDTNGSQFFITDKAARWLDDRHTIFGQCKKLNIIKKIATAKTGRRNKPLSPIRILRLRVHRGRF